MEYVSHFPQKRLPLLLGNDLLTGLLLGSGSDVIKGKLIVILCWRLRDIKNGLFGLL